MPPRLPNDDDHHIGWVTITYRSIFLAILGLLILIGVGAYFAFPGPTKSAMNTGLGWMTKLVERVVPSTADNAKKARPTGDQKASFTMIDGTVRVRKKSDNNFITAAFTTPLEKGDVVQTGPEGMAKIVFTDKTSYTVKPDSLIVIEENSTNENQQTKVSVQVTTGTVDLATANYSTGSQNKVIMAGAEASLAPESSAQVRNDQKKDNFEILVTKGTGEVKRGDETVSLANFDKVVFKAESKTMTKDKEVSPPTLLDPGNMISLFTIEGKQVSADLTWTPVSGARNYKLRIGKNAYFTQMVAERITGLPEVKIALPEGQYYWSVITFDQRGRPSMESDRFRFNVVPKAKEADLVLDLEDAVVRGRLVEIRGKTAPGARVTVNSAEIPNVQPDGTFNFLIPNLYNPGTYSIVVQAQSNTGAVNTKTVKAVVQ